MNKSTSTPFCHFNKICFYAVPHADDWQLFMQPNVYIDIIDPACKVVFLIITAGDAGKEDSYWLAREEGVKSSIRYCLAPRYQISEACGKETFNDHVIQYWSLNNIITYFFRIPDGNLDGSGFAACNFQSLFKLKAGDINFITAVDHSSTYHNWRDFIDTIESIINVEGQGISERWINYLNPDIACNPGDHLDHLTLGHAIQEMKMITTLHQQLFVGYSMNRIPDILSLENLFWKAGMLAVYEKAVYDFCRYSTLRENMDLYESWCCSGPKCKTILHKLK